MAPKSSKMLIHRTAVTVWYRKNGLMIPFEDRAAHTVTFDECNDDCTGIGDFSFPQNR